VLLYINSAGKDGLLTHSNNVKLVFCFFIAITGLNRRIVPDLYTGTANTAKEHYNNKYLKQNLAFYYRHVQSGRRVYSETRTEDRSQRQSARRPYRAPGLWQEAAQRVATSASDQSEAATRRMDCTATLGHPGAASAGGGARRERSLGVGAVAGHLGPGGQARENERSQVRKFTVMHLHNRHIDK